jgi:hypothetical protein
VNSARAHVSQRELDDIISTLESLRAALPVQDTWEASHDWEWEDKPIAYVRPASDGLAHKTILSTFDGDFSRIEAEEFEGRTKNYDREGQEITRYVAAMHNALPDLIAAVRSAQK